MTLPSDWKMGIFLVLEWYTEVPFLNRPRESPVFLIQNIECILELRSAKDDFMNGYNLYLKPKTSGTQLKPFPFTIYSDHLSFDSLSRYDGNFSHSKYCLKRIYEYEVKKRGASVDGAYFLKFVCLFGTGDGPSLSLKKKSDVKSVQTPLYIDAKFQLEGISNDFSSLFDEGPNHDVEFMCEDQTIQAHKSVLCCRSKVFASMLSSDMVEGKTKQVKIQDMNGFIFKQFLRCLYTGMLPELTADIAVQFYKAFDKYDVDALRKQCSNFLVENLTPDDAYEILIVADLHNDSDLKKFVMEYMVREETPLKGGEMWTEFCKKNPVLSNEVLNLFCRHLAENRP